MMNHAIFSNKVARIAAFTLAAGISSLSYAQKPGTPAVENYESLSKKIENVGALKNILNLRRIDDEAAIATSIILNPTLSESEVKELIKSYDERIGDTPAYLLLVANNTDSLKACRLVYLTKTTPKNAVTAKAVGECTGSATESPKETVPAPAPVAVAPPPSTPIPAPEPAAPIAAPAPAPAEPAEPRFDTAPPVPAPSAVNQPAPVVPVAPQPTAVLPVTTPSATSSLPFGLSLPTVIGLGGGAGVLVVGFGLVAISRRGSKSQATPAPTVETPKSAPAPAPAPAPQAPAKKDKKDDFTL